jgi:hypothetical protein
MASKQIFNNGISSLRVEFDGEIVAIIQETKKLEPQSIYMYEDELEKICEFVAMKKNTDFASVE